MPKFEVTIKQYFETIGEGYLLVDANTDTAARRKAQRAARAGEPVNYRIDPALMEKGKPIAVDVREV